MRCIDADALRESLDIDVFDCSKCKHGVSIYGYCSRGGEFQKACNEIEFAQTIDVAPVVHGRWIVLDECSNAGIYCSVCRKKVMRIDFSDTMGRKNFRFCPNCGARNIEGDDET